MLSDSQNEEFFNELLRHLRRMRNITQLILSLKSESDSVLRLANKKQIYQYAQQNLTHFAMAADYIQNF